MLHTPYVTGRLEAGAGAAHFRDRTTDHEVTP
jgi:hypothetical protein